MIKHKLKIEDTHFANIMLGRKKFEVRYNDRNYQLGDLIEFIHTNGCDRAGETFEIIFVQSGYGLQNEFVILGINPKGEKA